MSTTRCAVMLAVLSTLGCGSTSQREVRGQLYARGAGAGSVMAGAWTVQLEVARVGFGPVYFCATEAASRDLCPDAVIEYADSVTVDALALEPRLLGALAGYSGTVRSASFDYGITWFATRREPEPGAGAPGGHSAHFEGRAQRGDRTLRFVADVDVAPLARGLDTVQGLRTTVEAQGERLRLDLTFDPSAWWSRVDFDELATSPDDPVTVGPETRAYNAVVIAMTTGAPPAFAWSSE